MRLQVDSNRTGLSTIGLAGCVVLAGVIFADLSPWWLIASGFFILMGVGIESGQSKNNLQ